MKRLRTMRPRSDKGAATSSAELLVVAIAGAALTLVMASVGGLIRDQRVDWRHAVEDASEQAVRLVDVSASHAEARAACASPVPRYGEPEITLFSECWIVTREAGIFRPPPLGAGMNLPGWEDSVCVQTSGTGEIGTAAGASRRLECWWHEPGCSAMKVVEVPSTGDPDLLVAEYDAEITAVVPQANGCSTWTCDNTPPPNQKPCPTVIGSTGGQDATIEEVEWLCGDSQCFPASEAFIPTNSVRMVLTAGCSVHADIDQCRDLATRESAADGLLSGEHLTRTTSVLVGQRTNAISDVADFIEPVPVIQFGVEATDSTISPGTCETHIWHFLHQFDAEAGGGAEYQLEYLNRSDKTQASPSTVAVPSTPIPPTYTLPPFDNHGGNPPANYWTGAANGTSLRLYHGEYVLLARYRLEVDAIGIPTPGTGIYGPWSAPNEFAFVCPNTWRSTGNMNG